MFKRIDLVVLVPVVVGPGRAADGSDTPVDVTTEWTRDDGLREVRRQVVQDGPALRGDPDWAAGPAPWTTRRAVLGSDAHRSFHGNAGFDERAKLIAKVFHAELYGPDVRWHRAAIAEDQFAAWERTAARGGVPVPHPELLALELLRFDSPDGGPDGLLLLHARIDPSHADIVGAIRTAAMRESPAGRAWVAHLLRGAATLPYDPVPAYQLCSAQVATAMDEAVQPSGWTRQDECLWLLSTLQRPTDYTISGRNLKQIQGARRELSGDWTCAVMRAGAACVINRADDWQVDRDGRQSAHFVAEIAPLLVRSVYADALVMGIIGGLHLEGVGRRLAALKDPVSSPADLAALDSRFTTFRNTLWWPDIGRSGHTNLLLRSYAAAHQHQALFDRLVADLSDYSQKVEREESRRSNELAQGSNALIGLVTLFGLPLAALQVFGTGGDAVWWAIAAFVSLFALLPAGGEVLRLNLPPRWRGHASTWRVRLPWAVFWVLAVALLLCFDILPIEGSPERR